MESSDFSKLEMVVKKLLDTLGTTKDENASLLMQLKNKEKKIEELEQALSALNSDKNDINCRVSSLISSIEDWEKTASLSSAPEDENMENHADEPSDDVEKMNEEGPLFNMGE